MTFKMYILYVFIFLNIDPLVTLGMAPKAISKNKYKNKIKIE